MSEIITYTEEEIHTWLTDANIGTYELKTLFMKAEDFIAAVKSYIDQELGDYNGGDICFNSDYTILKKMDVSHFYKPNN